MKHVNRTEVEAQRFDHESRLTDRFPRWNDTRLEIKPILEVRADVRIVTRTPHDLFVDIETLVSEHPDTVLSFDWDIRTEPVPTRLTSPRDFLWLEDGNEVFSAMT